MRPWPEILLIEERRMEDVTRTFKLFTGGNEPGIDALAIMAALLKELKENERLAALQYCADLYGFSLVRKAR